MDELEQKLFMMISLSGGARSNFIEALQLAKGDTTSKMINEKLLAANQLLVDAHREHALLIQQEASGNNIKFSMLLMHAEDLLITTETLKIIIPEIIILYEKGV